jgi:hypothetical protein
LVNFLEKLSEQVKIINTSKQDLCRLNGENLTLKSRISELEGKVFSIEKSHGNRNKSINSEMVKENPVNSIINDGKSRKEVYMIPKSILCREYNFVLTLKCKCLAMTNEAAH